MNKSIFERLKEILPVSRNYFSLSKHDPTIKGSEFFLNSINKKIYEINKEKKETISLEEYHDYFSILKKLGLWIDFDIKTTKDNLFLKGSLIKSPLINQNNEKFIIFCHGITNNRWSFFYCIHIVLQLGYNVVIYDARNHGMSQSSYNTLGKIESFDLEDIINWVKNEYKPKKIGLYGFSMGSATLLFWIGRFQNFHPEIKFVICDSPFDDFEIRFKNFLSVENVENEKENKGISWKEYIFNNFAKQFLNSPFDLSKIKPIDSLPKKLNLKLLILHGTKDTVIPWKASFEIFKKLKKEKKNEKLINFYLIEGANHGEVPFFGDFIPNSFFWAKREKKISNFCFSSLIFNFLVKNF